MLTGDVLNWMNALAPFESAESYDNVGLLVGDAGAEVGGVMFALDVTETLISEAEASGANLIVVHHPLIFHPIRRIDYTAPQGRLLCELLARRMNVIAAHTNWDKAPGGVSDSLAKALELRNVERGDDYLRVGELPAPMTAAKLGQAIQTALRTVPRRYGDTAQTIRRVAVAGGAYGEGAELAWRMGAQAYLTGELHHHEAMDACARGLLLYDGGHYATEIPGIRALYERYLADAREAGFTAPACLHTTAPYAGATLAL